MKLHPAFPGKPALFVSLVLCTLAASSLAQDYPSRSVRVIVPFAVGGGTDLLGRDMATAMQKRLGQSFVVENKAGAGGLIGSDTVVRAAPDGYTLLISTNSAAVIDATAKAPPFRLSRDLAGVSMLAEIPVLLVVNNDVPANNVQELIALLKREPGKLNYASAGTGTIMHISAELFASLSGTAMTHIPFKGANQMVPELLSGRVQILFGAANTLTPLIKTGQLRVLGVGGHTRWADMPNVPTISESGVPGFYSNNWYSVMAPKNTPRPIIAKLNAEIGAYLADPATRERYAAQGMTPRATSADQLDQAVLSEIDQWASLAKKAGFSME